MQAVNRVSVVQQVADSIKEYIMSGELEVGDKLPSEMKLCETLHVGRGTLREAIRVLQMTGFVEMRPGRGAFVASVTEPSNEDVSRWFQLNEVELLDFLRVRAVLEPLAIRLAIEHRTCEDIQTLTRIHQCTEQAVLAQDALQLALCDEQFHSFIFSCSQNPLLISINQLMNDYLKNFRGKTFHIANNARNVLEPHAEILHAFIDGDTAQGEEMMMKHMCYILRDLEKSKEKE